MSSKKRDIAATGSLGSTHWILDRTAALYDRNHLMTARIAVSLYRLAEHLGMAVEAVLAPHHLSRAEFEALQSLELAGPEPGLTPSDLYQAVLMSSGGITKLLKQLAGKGYVEMTRDTNDGRQRRVRLTQAGAAKLAGCLADVMAVETRLIAQAGANLDKATFADMLETAVTDLEKAMQA